MRRLVLFGLAGLVWGCGSGTTSAPPPVLPARPAFVFRDPFVETDPARTVDPYITDGFTSWRIGPDGGIARVLASDLDPQLSLDQPHIRVNLAFDDVAISPLTGTNYEQSIESQMLVAVTNWTQSQAEISRRIAVNHKGELQEELSITAKTDCEFSIISEQVGKDGEVAVATQINDPANTPAVISALGRRTYALEEGESLSLTIQHSLAGAASLVVPTRSAKLTIIDSQEDNLAVNSFITHLTAQIVPASELNGRSDHAGLGPFGVSDPKYRGMVFWDTDIWMFPALAILSPDRAKRVSDYRLARIPAAEREFKKWTDNGAPTVRTTDGENFGLLNPILTDRAPTNPLKYPWESDIDGNEASPTETIHQVHITADVSLMLDTAAALGLTSPRQAESVRRRAAAFFAARMNLRDDGKTEIRGVVSPDEFFQGDNDLYTNMIAQRLMRRTTPDWPWEMHLPQDETSFLTYDGDPIRGYKQAAALLTVWPLQDPRAEAQAEVMLDRFSDKTTPNGPAMSGSLHALIRARFGDPNEALEEWRAAWQRCTNRSMLLFSEKPNSDENVFLTGVAGSLNTVLYGFLGFRFDEHEPAEADWKTKLDDGWWLSCSPNLPDDWEAVVLENVEILGKKYIFRAGHTGVDVSELSD